MPQPEKTHYTHYSQIHINDVMPGTLRPDVAGRMAQALGLEAFQYSLDYQWYAFKSDDDNDDFIKLSNKMAIAMHEFTIDATPTQKN